MFTRNFDQLMIASLINYTSSTYAKITDEFGDDKLSFKNYNGDQYPITYTPTSWFNCILRTNDPNSMSVSYSSLMLGSSNTPEDYNDYSIANFANMSVEAVSSTSGISGNIPYVNISRYVKNNASTSAVIREVGIYVCFNTKMGSSSTSPAKVLLYRKVLDTPVTLESGRVVEVNLRLEFQRLNKPNVSVVINGG